MAADANPGMKLSLLLTKHKINVKIFIVVFNEISVALYLIVASDFVERGCAQIFKDWIKDTFTAHSLPLPNEC